MITNIPTPQRSNNKVQGEFYPLQKQELIALRKAKLINNTAFVHLALRYENPFCDRPIEVNPKEFSLAWNIPESSVYEAIGKLKKLGILLIKKGKVIIEWVKEKISIPVENVSQEHNSQLPEILRNSRTNSEIPEKILRSQKNLRDPIINSENSENRSSETLPELDSNSPQTIQTKKTSSYVSNYETHTQEKVLQDKKKENGQEVFHEFAIDQEKITDELAKSINQQEEEFFRSCSANEIKKIQEYVKIYKEEDKLESHPSKGFNHRSNYKDKRRSPKVRFQRANRLSRTQSINWQWMPEGAWNINGKLDPAFQEWLAKRWLAKHKDILDIYEAKANVLAYFCNKPEKLPIRWEEYQEEFLAKADNIKTRLDHQCKIKDKEKKDFLDRLGALKPLDESQSVSANNPIDASNLVLNQYQKLNQENKEDQDEAVSEQSLPVGNLKQDADVKIVIDENDVIVETKESSVNTSTTPIVNIYAEDQYGAKVKSNDFTGCHEKEQIPVNKNAINAIADWLKAKKGGRK